MICAVAIDTALDVLIEIGVDRECDAMERCCVDDPIWQRCPRHRVVIDGDDEIPF